MSDDHICICISVSDDHLNGVPGYYVYLCLMII